MTSFRPLAGGHTLGWARLDCGGAWRAVARIACVAGLVLGAHLPASAQRQNVPTLSSPIGGAPSATPSSRQPAATSAIPQGTGAGQHSPNSPYAALPQRDDVVPWSVLTTAKPKRVGKRFLPDFPADVRALDGTMVRIQGFMMPLAPGQMQSHFLIASVPLTCAFCTPGGPESMLEVRTRTPVKYGMEGVVMQGRLQVLDDDPQGLYYRMTDAVAVK